MAQPTACSLYDLPRYYDVVFSGTSTEEHAFLRECFELYATRRVRRVYEPACGSGRLLAALAREGFAVSGCDLSAEAVRYANARLRRLGHAPAIACADMCEHRPAPRADAAFNLVSSIQHLTDEASALAHLRAVATGLARGGVYVIGLQLLPTAGRRSVTEHWRGDDVRARVATTLRSLALNRRGRRETCRLHTRIVDGRKRINFSDTVHFRTYTLAQWRRLLAWVPKFETVATYDFSYQIWSPIRVGPKTQDVIHVLRRR